MFISTNLNDTLIIGACGETVALPGGAGGGLSLATPAVIATFVAPPTGSGFTFKYCEVSIPSLHVRVMTNDLRLSLPAGYLWNNAQIEAF